MIDLLHVGEYTINLEQIAVLQRHTYATAETGAYNVRAGVEIIFSGGCHLWVPDPEAAELEAKLAEQRDKNTMPF